MSRYAFFRPYQVTIGGRTFLKRRTIFLTPLCGLLWTRIYSADDQRQYPHDHSASFWSLKFGWYAEDVHDKNGKRHVMHLRFSCHLMRYDQAHSITAVSPHLRTLVLVLRHRQDPSYWTPQGKVPTGMKPR